MFILQAQQPLGGLVVSLGKKDRPALPGRLLAAGRREGPQATAYPADRSVGQGTGGRERLGKFCRQRSPGRL